MVLYGHIGCRTDVYKRQDNHRAEMQKYETEESLLQYLKHQNILEQFARFAESKGLRCV